MTDTETAYLFAGCFGFGCYRIIIFPIQSFPGTVIPRLLNVLTSNVVFSALTPKFIATSLPPTSPPDIALGLIEETSRRPCFVYGVRSAN